MARDGSNDLLIGIDVGTTGTKAMLVDPSGMIVAQAYVGYSLQRPRALVVEQSAEHWWEAVVTTVRECLVGVDATRVRAIAVSSQGGSLVVVDENDDPLAPARSWLDRRADAEVARLEERFGSREFFQLTGWRLYGAYNCVQLLDMRHSEPDLFRKASAFLGTGEFINARLTGMRAADLNGAGITQLLDVTAATWSPETLDFIGVEESRLAALCAPGDPIGTLTPQAAEQLGLSTEVVVAGGGHDQYCAALGAGVTAPGDVLLSTGTAWVVLGITETAIADPAQNFGFGRHVVPDVWGEFGSFRNGGVCLDWTRRLLGGAAPDNYDVINTRAASAPVGSDGLRFFPHFDGTNIPTWVGEAKGSFTGLELRHGPEQFYRGVMEGVVYEGRRVLESYQSFGPQVSKVTILGGASHSRVWAQIIADVLTGPVEITDVPDSACVGAAVLAGVGAGMWSDAGTGSTALVPRARLVEPSDDKCRYAALYEEYCRSSVHLMDHYRGEERS